MLENYLKKIGIEKKDLQQLSNEEKLSYLNSVYFAHLTHFPYQNFQLRKISQQHPIHRQSLNLFDYKNLLSVQTGGYCYQSTRMLYVMLKELGFDIHCCSARVINGAEVNSPAILSLPATHSAIVVLINDQKYYLDPGLGAASPRAPILIAGQENEVTQDYSKFKLSVIDDLYVFEQFKDGAWFRVSQAGTKAVDDKHLAFTLLQLERSPQNLPIRDQLTLVGMVTPTGSKSLMWNPKTEKITFTVEDKGVRSVQEVDSFIQATIKLMTEFNITHVSADDLKGYCRKENNVPKPQKAWEVDFPLDKNELDKMARNLNP